MDLYRLGQLALSVFLLTESTVYLYLLAGTCIGEDSSDIELLPHCFMELEGGGGGLDLPGGGWSGNLDTDSCLIGGGARPGMAGRFPRLTGVDCVTTGAARGSAGADTLAGGGDF